MSAATDSQTAARGGVALVVRFAVIAILNYGLGVALTWLLPTQEYGRVSAVQATLLLAAYVLNSGFPWTLAWFEARRDNLQPDHLNAVFRSSLVGNLCFGVVLGLGFLALQAAGVRLVPNASRVLALVLAVTFPVLALNAVAKGALHGRRQFTQFGAVQASEVLVKCLVALVLVLVLPIGAVAVALAFLVGALVAAILGVWALRSVLPGRGPMAGWATYRASLPMFVGSAGFALFSTLDILGLQVIGHVAGRVTAAELAVYQVAVLLARAPYFVADALADAVFPFIARRHDVPAASHAWFGSAARWILLAVVPLELVIVLCPEPLLELFFPSSYQSALPLIRLVGVGAIGMIACGVLGKTLQALGRRDAVARTMPVVLLVELSLLALLVPRLAAVGAAIAFSAAAWTGGALLTAAYYRHQSVPLPPRSIVARYGLALAALVSGLALVPDGPPAAGVGLIGLVVVFYAVIARRLDLVTADDTALVRRVVERAVPRRFRAAKATTTDVLPGRHLPWLPEEPADTAAPDPSMEGWGLGPRHHTVGEGLGPRHHRITPGSAPVDDRTGGHRPTREWIPRMPRLRVPRLQPRGLPAVAARDPRPSNPEAGWFARWLLARPFILGLGLFVLSLAPFTAHVTTSPDTQYDEVVYTRASQLVATGHLTWSTEPVFVHPPLYFLVQSVWLRVAGAVDAGLFTAIHAARLLTTSLGAANAALTGMLAYLVTSKAAPRRRLTIIAAVVVVTATDPVLLRYSRLAIIDPLALFGCLVTLLVAWWARRLSAPRYVLTVGLLTGLTLLVKEISVFLLLTPVAFAVAQRDLRCLRRAAAALVLGCTVWLLFPLWAVQLGASGRFWEVKLFTAQRLVGALQVTGWNRPGVSLVAALERSAPQYMTSYVLLLCGAVALLWLFFRRSERSGDLLFALLVVSYLFAGYIAAVGTLNEQFFVYVLPAAIIGTVLGLDALVAAIASHALTRRVLAAPLRVATGCLVGLALLVPLGGLASWRVQYGGAPNNGIERMATFVDERYPVCATFNVSGDLQKYAYSLQGRSVTRYGSGVGALGEGVHLFFLNPKDAVVGYGRMSADFATWIRTHGRPLATFRSLTYSGAQLWEVKSDQYDPAADIQPIDGGVFVNTVGSRCGGYRIKNNADGLFLREYNALGGKSVAGPPISRIWREGDRTYQAFDGALLQTRPTPAGRPPAVRALAEVPVLAQKAPATYRRYQLPPVRYARATDPKVVLPRLDDVRIARAYLGVPRDHASAKDVARALSHLGAPLGPATRMPDGSVRQAFENVVYERPPTTPDVVRLAPLGRAISDGLKAVPTTALQPDHTPPLPLPEPARLPTDVLPFVRSLSALLVGYLAAWCLLIGVRRRWSARGPAVDEASDDAARESVS